MLRLATLFLVLSVPLAAAQTAAPTQLETYVTILVQDRNAYQRQLDLLRLEIEEQKRLAAAHDVVVDAYWRAYTGLAEEKK